MTSKLNRDPILLDIELDPVAVSLIDTPVMQRLRRTNQLGFSDLVYDGARHSRLAHSKGVYARVLDLFDNIAANHHRKSVSRDKIVDHPGELLDKIWGESPPERWSNCARVCAWAALLHDATHIAVGHTLEDEFTGLYVKHDSLLCPRHVHVWGCLKEPAENSLAKGFENAAPFIERELPVNPTGQLINLHDPNVLKRLLHLIVLHRDSKDKASFSEIVDHAVHELDSKTGEALPFPYKENDAVDRQKSLLKELKSDYVLYSDVGLFHPFMTDIISNTICADLLDYLERDTFYTGLRESYDPRIVQTFVLMKNGEELRMVVDIWDRAQGQKRDVLTDVLNLLKLRHDLAMKVYYHKTKVAAGAMLVAALRALGTAPVDGSPDDPDSISHFTMSDEGLMLWIRAKAISLAAAKPKPKPKAKKDEPAEKPEQAVELIEAILKRQLHKVLVAAPWEGYWSKFDRNTLALNEFRKNHNALCKNLAEILDCEEGEVILFLPPFKTTAKEVRARALKEDDNIDFLEDIPDIQEDIKRLNKNYNRLWHLYVFVKSDITNDKAQCSNIVDAAAQVIQEKLPEMNTGTLSDYARYPYLDKSTRLRVSPLEEFEQPFDEADQNMRLFAEDGDAYAHFQAENGLGEENVLTVLTVKEIMDELPKGQKQFSPEKILATVKATPEPKKRRAGKPTKLSSHVTDHAHEALKKLKENPEPDADQGTMLDKN